MLRLNLLDQQRRHRADLVAGEDLMRREIAREWVMVDDVNRGFRLDALELGDALRVNQRDLLDLIELVVFVADEGQGGSIEPKKRIDVAVEAVGQHWRCVRVELVRRQQRRQRVEICIFVTQDNLHKTSSLQTGLL